MADRVLCRHEVVVLAVNGLKANKAMERADFDHHSTNDEMVFYKWKDNKVVILFKFPWQWRTGSEFITGHGGLKGALIGVA